MVGHRSSPHTFCDIVPDRSHPGCYLPIEDFEDTIESSFEALFQKEYQAAIRVHLEFLRYPWHIVYHGLAGFFPDREIRYVTFLRDPFKRIISEYNFGRMRLALNLPMKKKVLERLKREFMEKGKYNPSLKLAHDVAKALNTTIEELFIFEED